MKVTTKQVDAAEALKAVAEGKQVQMICEHEGTIYSTSLNHNIHDIMKINDAFLVVEIEEEPTEEPDEDIQPEPVEEVPETIVTDPDTTPITVKIPNSKKAEKERHNKINDERIIKLRKDGLSEFKIAEELDVSQVTIANHIKKLKKEGRL